MKGITAADRPPFDSAPAGQANHFPGYLALAVLSPALLAIGPLTLLLGIAGRGPALWLAIVYQTATVVVWAGLAVPLITWTRRSTESWLVTGVRTTLPIELGPWLTRVVGCILLHAFVITLATFALHLGGPVGEQHLEIVSAAGVWRPVLGFAVATFFYFPFDLIAAGSITAVAISAAQRREGLATRSRAAGLERQLEEARLQSLRARLEPHFLFNALGAATALARRNAGDEAARVLVSLSDLLRRAMDTSTQGTVPLATEFDFLKQYLEIEQVRFGDRLTITVEASPEALACTVPSLLVQPLVENGVKHGIAQREAAGGTISVRAWVLAGQLHVEVTDNGAGFVGPVRVGVGLASTKERLATLYGDQASLDIVSHPDAGVRATITMPAEITRTTAQNA